MPRTGAPSIKTLEHEVDLLEQRSHGQKRAASTSVSSSLLSSQPRWSSSLPRAAQPMTSARTIGATLEHHRRVHVMSRDDGIEVSDATADDDDDNDGDVGPLAPLSPSSTTVAETAVAAVGDALASVPSVAAEEESLLLWLRGRRVCQAESLCVSLNRLGVNSVLQFCSLARIRAQTLLRRAGLSDTGEINRVLVAASGWLRSYTASQAEQSLLRSSNVKPPKPSTATVPTTTQTTAAQAVRERTGKLEERIKQLEEECRASERRVAQLEAVLATVTCYELDEEAIEVDESARLGTGAVGEVFLGRFAEMRVAVKRLRAGVSVRDGEYFRAEAGVMWSLRHPNVVQLLGVCLDYGACHDVVLVMEYMMGGTLHSALRVPSFALTGVSLSALAADVARGLHYLHSRAAQVVHRDVKSANVLLSSLTVGSVTAKLADFGFARVSTSHVGTSGALRGTPAWLAPEMLIARNVSGGELASAAVDVYGFGVLLWEMVARKTPFKDMPAHAVFEAVVAGRRPKIPDSCEAWLAALMRACWHREAVRRPTMREVLRVLEENE